MRKLAVIGVLLYLIGGVVRGQEVQPPVDYLIDSAEYKFHLDEREVKCLVVFGLTVFPSDKFIHVPILKDEVSPTNISVNGKIQDLTPIGGWLVFLPEETGSYTIEVEFSLRPEILKGIRSISVATPVSAVNRVRFKSEKPWLVSSNRLPFQIEVGGDESGVAVFPGEEFKLQWEEVPVEVERPPLLNAAPDIFYLFEGPDLHVSARLAVTIYAGMASRVNLDLPPDARKISLHGAQVRRWTQEGEKVTIDFKGKIEARTDVFYSFSLPVGNGQDFVWLPVPSIQGARITGGTIAISCPSDSDLMVENISQLEEIAVYEIPVSLKSLMRSQPVLAFQIRGDSPRLSIKPVSLKPAVMVEAVADRVDFTSFRGPEGEETIKVKMSVRNDRRQFLRVSLPDGARLVCCSVSGREMVPGREADGEILIPLERSIETLEGIVSFPVEFVCFTKNPTFDRKGSASFMLPSLDIPIAHATWTAYLPDGIKIIEVSGNMAYVKRFEEATEKLEYGRGYLKTAPATEVQILGEVASIGMGFRKKLVENYWNSATEAYKTQDYEEAERNLKVILEKYPESEFAKDANQLMDNVSLALKPQGRRETATYGLRYGVTKRIQKGMESQQFRAKIEQEELIKKAEEAELKGEDQKSIALMEKAVQQSEIMLKRGVSGMEQKAIMKDVSAKLESGRRISAKKTRLQEPTREVEERIKSEVHDKRIFVMEEKDFNGLTLTDEPLSENERKQFLETFSSNVAYRVSSQVSAPYAPPPAQSEDKISEVAVKFSGKQAGEAFDLLMKIKGKGAKIANLSISTNNRILARDITTVGAALNAFASGYYAVLDKAQKDTLGEMKPPDVSELGTIQLPQFLVGNTAVMPNEERVSLSRSEGTDNVFVLGDNEVRLKPNQFLLITNRKGTNILGVSQTVGLGEAIPEMRIKGKGFTFDVPCIGKAHLFEKLLLQPGEKPQILIEYEGKGRSI